MSIIPALLLLMLAGVPPPVVSVESRRVIDLNGTWEIAQGDSVRIPDQFNRHVPVPGLADMAEPPFRSVGVRDERDTLREAFWYRRTFIVPGQAPAVALLKVHKAMYGTRVYLNGRLVGEHMPSFTPGYFDLKRYLRAPGEANELIICVGAARAAMPGRYMDGHDYEKTRYIPGIYDNVELICSGSPHIIRIQTAAEIDRGSVLVSALIANAGKSRTTRIRCRVREATGGKIVAEEISAPVQLGAGAERSVEMRITIPVPRLWSPEDPFMYELEATTGFDSVVVPFGMRSFRFDAESGRAFLNNRPYYLRGTNICILRFFEDPWRADLPWREAWVRKVIRAFKSMHWNSARYCIGFPPEIWYKVADEEGFMIEDEAPIWLNQGMKQREQMTVESLVGEFSEWMQERWNHPSVVIWDAQNESERWPLTGQVIGRVRGLDLSNRPWENGWSPRQADGDPVETHSYYFSQKKFRIPRLANETGDGMLLDSVAVPRRGAILLNEYGWIWIDRGGMPTTLSAEYRSYERIRPDVAVWTPGLYRETYARTLALLTEFFRGHRKLAGVLHFCGLGYSRPGGQTSDNFIDINSATLEPHFVRYVRDAFAPVGLMIDFWADSVSPGSVQKIPVRVINDLYGGWRGNVVFRLMDGDRAVAEQKREVAVPALGMEVVTFDFTCPSRAGRYQLVAEISGASGETVRSLRDFVSGESTERESHPPGQ